MFERILAWSFAIACIALIVGCTPHQSQADDSYRLCPIAANEGRTAFSPAWEQIESLVGTAWEPPPADALLRWFHKGRDHVLMCVVSSVVRARRDSEGCGVSAWEFERAGEGWKVAEGGQRVIFCG